MKQVDIVIAHYLRFAWLRKLICMVVGHVPYLHGYYPDNGIQRNIYMCKRKCLGKIEPINE